jgi:hypothetical protein
VKSFKALADGKDVFYGTKTGSGIFAYISSITCAPCKTSSDWIRVLVAVTNESANPQNELNLSQKCFSSFLTFQHTYNKTILIGW